MMDDASQPTPLELVTGLRCARPRCATLLPITAAICDECGGTEFEPLASLPAVLVGDAGDRWVAFALDTRRPNIIGRWSPTQPRPDIDLGRLPGASSVHRRHARIEQREGTWQITHLGRNALVVERGETSMVMQPGTSRSLLPGDRLIIGALRFQLLLRPGTAARS